MAALPNPPALMDRPFAENGDKASIPVTTEASGRASLASGFPLETQLPLNAGGVPPARLDVNGILNLLSQHAFWQQSGGLPSWSIALNYALPSLVFYNGRFYLAVAPSGPNVSGAGAKQPGAAGSEGFWLDYALSIAPPAPEVEKYDLGEFYYFRHPTLKPGFQPAQGGLLYNVPALYPKAWAYLQTVEGQKLCTTEAQWQNMVNAVWHTNADGSRVGWNGIGGAPCYVINTGNGTLRLPDLRGMYAEAAGFDALGVGGAHGDGVPRITASALQNSNGGGRGFLNHGDSRDVTGAFVSGAPKMGGLTGPDTSTNYGLNFDSGRVTSVAAKVQPRAWGSLACVYLGL